MNPALSESVHRSLLASYEWLLGIYPSAFRERFGTEMAQAFRDALEDATARGPGALMSLCFHSLVDIVVNGAAERLAGWSRSARSMEWRLWWVGWVTAVIGTVCYLLQISVRVACIHWFNVLEDVPPADWAPHLWRFALTTGLLYAISQRPRLKHIPIALIRSIAVQSVVVVFTAILVHFFLHPSTLPGRFIGPIALTATVVILVRVAYPHVRACVREYGVTLAAGRALLRRIGERSGSDARTEASVDYGFGGKPYFLCAAALGGLLLAPTGAYPGADQFITFAALTNLVAALLPSVRTADTVPRAFVSHVETR